MTSTSIARAVGANLLERRQALGWSRATLAMHSGTSVPTIQRFELYGSTPYYTTLDAWAGALHCTISDLTNPGYDDGEATGVAN